MPRNKFTPHRPRMLKNRFHRLGGVQNLRLPREMSGKCLWCWSSHTVSNAHYSRSADSNTRYSKTESTRCPVALTVRPFSGFQKSYFPPSGRSMHSNRQRPPQCTPSRPQPGFRSAKHFLHPPPSPRQEPRRTFSQAWGCGCPAVAATCPRFLLRLPPAQTRTLESTIRLDKVRLPKRWFELSSPREPPGRCGPFIRR